MITGINILKFKQMETFIEHLPKQLCHLVLLSHLTTEETKARKGEYNPLWVHSFILNQVKIPVTINIPIWIIFLVLIEWRSCLSIMSLDSPEHNWPKAAVSDSLKSLKVLMSWAVEDKWMVMNNYFYLIGLIKHSFFPSLKFWGLLLSVWQKCGPCFLEESQFRKITSLCQIGHLKHIKCCIQIFVLRYVIIISKNGLGFKRNYVEN